MADNRLAAVAALLLSVMILGTGLADAQLVAHFYKGKCPNGVDPEAIIKASIINSFRNDKGIAPGIVRIMFHDCFVDGCDGSVLINSTGSEQSAPPNSSLRKSGLDAINAAKAAVEAVCPGVVSCADIVILTAAKLVGLTVGVEPSVVLGRRDGLTASSGNVNLPSPALGVSGLTSAFSSRGLSQRDMVVLSGAHTIGVAHCQAINARLYTPASTDPPLDPTYAATLKAQCPQGTTSTTITVNMDPVTPGVFDNKYYSNLIANKGLFVSDGSLNNDSSTKPLVQTFSTGKSWRNTEFPASFNKMAAIGVLTGTAGQIRQFCWKFN